MYRVAVQQCCFVGLAGRFILLDSRLRGNDKAAEIQQEQNAAQPTKSFALSWRYLICGS
jgi:hypothetical protein